MAKSFNDLPPVVQAAVLIGGAVAVAGAVAYLGIPAVVDSIPDLSAKRDRLEREVKKLHEENLQNQAFELKLTEYKVRMAQLEQQLETLRGIVPDEQATDEFMKLVFNAAASSAINVRTFVAQPIVARDFYYEMPFNVRIDGTYWSILSFFDRLAHEQRTVSVTNLSLGGPAGGGMGTYTIRSNETVGANCAIVTYFNRPQTAPAKAKKK